QGEWPALEQEPAPEPEDYRAPVRRRRAGRAWLRPAAAGCGRESAESGDRRAGRGHEAENGDENADGARALDDRKHLITEHGGQNRLACVEHDALDLIAGGAGRHHERVRLGGDPENRQRDDRHERRGQGPDGDSCRAGPWDVLGDRVAGGDVPGHEHRDLEHDPVGEVVRRREMGEIFERIHDEAGFIDLRAAFGTIANMGFQGVYPEAHLVIEEEVDLIWKQVPVIHGVSGMAYGASSKFVSVQTGDFLNGVICRTSRWFLTSALRTFARNSGLA